MPFLVGITDASAGRSTPGIRPRINNEHDITAPVFPADKNASALPSLTRLRPT